MKILKLALTKSHGYVVAWAILLLGTVSITTMTEVMIQKKANRSNYISQTTDQLFSQIEIIKAALNECSESLSKTNLEIKKERKYPTTAGNEPTYIIEMRCAKDPNNTENTKKLIPSIKRIDISPPSGFKNWAFLNQNTTLSNYPELKRNTPTIYIMAEEQNENANTVLGKLIDYTLPEKKQNNLNKNINSEENKPLKNKGNKRDKNSSNAALFYLELEQ